MQKHVRNWEFIRIKTAFLRRFPFSETREILTKLTDIDPAGPTTLPYPLITEERSTQLLLSRGRTWVRLGLFMTARVTAQVEN